jgi:hypothetical protein
MKGVWIIWVALCVAVTAAGYDTPILLLCHNRPEELQVTLGSLLRVRGVRKELILAAQDVSAVFRQATKPRNEENETNRGCDMLK